MKKKILVICLLFCAFFLVGCGKKDKENEELAEKRLKVACRNLNAKGSFEDDRNKCSDFICETEIDGKSYKKDCREVEE